MYGDSISRDMNSLLYSSTFKHPLDGEFAKIKELISADPYPSYDNYKQHNRNQNENQQQHDGEFQNESSLMRNRPAPNSFFLNLLNGNGCQDFLDPVTASSPEQQQVSESDSPDVLQYSLSLTAIKQETKETEIKEQDLRPPAIYTGDSCHAPTLPPSNISNKDNTHNHRNLVSWSSYRVMNSTSSNLIRQNSSPAEFLSSSTVGNGFFVGKGDSANRLNNNHITFSSSPSSLRFLPQIAENENEMDDTSFNSLKRSRNGDFLQFQQDLVPCKIRAKRGFATHPRSIAERERRTRISERIKKLQELFPNMDKQMNIADMLDMALDYIKDLQKEVQSLNDAQARCMCSSKQLQSGSTK